MGAGQRQNRFHFLDNNAVIIIDQRQFPRRQYPIDLVRIIGFVAELANPRLSLSITDCKILLAYEVNKRAPAIQLSRQARKVAHVLKPVGIRIGVASAGIAMPFLALSRRSSQSKSPLPADLWYIGGSRRAKCDT